MTVALARLTQLHRWMAAHLAGTLVLSVLFLAAALALSLRGTAEHDIGAMLPDGPGSPREAARLLNEFGALNTLLLDLEEPGATADQLAERGAQLQLRLKQSGFFAEVYSGPATQELLRLGQVILPRRLYLLSDPAREIELRLESARLKASLTALKAQLASPQAIAMKREILLDPLGINADLFSALTAMAGDVHPYRGQLLSKDEHHLLLVTTPRQSALDTRSSAALLETIRAEARRIEPGPAGPAVLRAVGGPRFAAESAQAVRRDVVLTLGTSAVGLIALFLARFRSLRLMFLSSIPLAFGVVGGLASVVLVQGRIHSLTFAFGSVLIGVGIDYPLYLLNAASVQRGEPLERMSAALRETWRSLWLGFSTTLLAFAVMLFSRFPGLRELALFAGGGIVVSFIATLALLVPFCARWGPKRWSGIPSWMPALRIRKWTPLLAWGAALAVFSAAIALIPSLRFDGELRHLDAQRPETLAEYEEVMNRFGLPGGDSLAVSRGRTEEEALATNDAVLEVLAGVQKAGPPSAVRGIGAFLPARATQEKRARRLTRLDLPAARARLSSAAAKEGFSPSAFDGFWEEVDAVRTGRIAPLSAADFADTSLQPLLKRLLRCSPDGCIAVSSFKAASAAELSSISSQLPAGVMVLDAGSLAAETVAQIPRQLVLLTGVGLLLNLLLLGFAYRSARLAIAACLPGCLGLLATLAALSAMRVPLNLVSGSALVLILGCGVDYGIFALQGLAGSNPESRVESTGVMLTSITALAGFGTLVLASYRALQSLGEAVGLGIVISAAAAIFLLPGLYQGLRSQPARAPTGGKV